MKTSKQLTFVLLFITVLVVGSMNSFTEARSRKEQEPTISEEQKATLAVVQQYLSLSSAGKFDELSEITILKPKRYRRVTVDVKELVKKYPPGTAVVIPNEKVWEKSDLRRLRQEYPQFLRDTGARVVIVAGVFVKDDLAKVSVHFGNESQYQALPTVFVLTRETPEEKWKIFDITSPAYAADYK
jgi:hypothetical protein